MKEKKITIKMPESLDDITISKFQQIEKLTSNIEGDVYKSLQLISLVTGLSNKQILALTEGSMQLLAEEIMQMLVVEPKLKAPPEFNNTSVLNFESMTFGQFIDIHTLLDKKIDNAQYLLSQLYYKGEYKGNDFKDAAAFDTYPTSAYNDIFNKVAAFYSEVISHYYPEQEKTEEEIFNNKASFSKKWGWYVAVANLANNEVLKIDAVTKLPFREALTFIAYMRDYNAIS